MKTKKKLIPKKKPVLEKTVKAAVKKRLKELGVFQFWPVQFGLGSDLTLDCFVCSSGLFYAIECKAPGKLPTPRQRHTIDKLREHGADVYVIDNVEDAKKLVL